MPFQFHALDADEFAPFFEMGPSALTEAGAYFQEVMESPGTPCRVSLEDAPVGEKVLAINYTHQKAHSPYRASHAVFVRPDVATAKPAANEVPKLLRHRLLSLRGFNADGILLDADAVEGTEIEGALEKLFGIEAVSEIHVHYAKPGCFAARVTRR